MNSFQSEILSASGFEDLNPRSEQIKTFQGSSGFAVRDGIGAEPRETPKDWMGDFSSFIGHNLV